jgi:hypothetical protein
MAVFYTGGSRGEVPPFVELRPLSGDLPLPQVLEEIGKRLGVLSGGLSVSGFWQKSKDDAFIVHAREILNAITGATRRAAGLSNADLRDRVLLVFATLRRLLSDTAAFEDLGRLGRILELPNPHPHFRQIQRPFVAANAQVGGLLIELADEVTAAEMLAGVTAATTNARVPASPAAQGTGDAHQSLDLEAAAIGLLTRHTDWSNKQIAKKLGCHPKTLSDKNWTRFRAARRALKSGRADLPRGTKLDGDVEAIEDDDEG